MSDEARVCEIGRCCVRRALAAWLACGVLVACSGVSPLSSEPKEGPAVDAGRVSTTEPDAGPPKAPAAKPPCGMGPGCDPTDLGGESCESLGLGAGTLLCDPRTCTFEVVLCTGLEAPDTDKPPCGGGDDCDPTDLDGETCDTLGLGVGFLACNAETCTFDTSLCFSGGAGAGGGGGGGTSGL